MKFGITPESVQLGIVVVDAVDVVVVISHVVGGCAVVVVCGDSCAMCV